MLVKITIPNEVKLLVKPGQEVDFDTDLYESSQKNEIIIPLAKNLGVSSNNIFKHLKKFVGETIEKGELLALKNNFFNKAKIFSDYSGIIREVNHETGEVIIAALSDKKLKKKAFFKGKVDNIDKNHLHVEIRNKKNFALKQVSEDHGGEVVYFSKTLISQLDELIIQGKIVVTESLNSYTQVKLEALGSIGFITLNPLPENSKLFSAKIKNIDDFSKIIDYNLKYCLVLKDLNEVYFYE